MLLQALVALLDPSRAGAPTQLVLSLALVAAAVLIIAAAAALPVPALFAAPAVRAFARRARVTARPRLADPDAAGRPRSRAPSGTPAAA
ncbi:DUF6412 domain-containing protein [Paractinoplanes globisporus]|jgi:hypothetical protein|uniref:DUF6412 domain-containing protein n=1 Tax=Paractinoplanes globisporus TaxID=113565 RepID=A0ABW6WNF3_9ACTN|nr:DUF6412 domain-containing protein [Actinoplanes globisporus]